MTAAVSPESFTAQADRYFSRTSISNPIYIGPDQIAYLDTTSGTKQIGVVTFSTRHMAKVTSYNEGLLSLLGSSQSGHIVFGMDLGGNERQQLYVISDPGQAPVRLTPDDSAFYEPGALSAEGDRVVYRTNDRDEGTFDIKVSRLDTGESETWLMDGGQVSAVALSGDRALVIRANGNMDCDLLLVKRDGTVRNLTEHKDELWVYDARFNQDGTGIWILSNLDREFVALMYHDLESGEQRVVFEAEWDVEHFALSPDGSSVALSVNENGASRPAIISTSGAQEPVNVATPHGVIDGFSWSPDSGSVAFGLSTTEQPSVIMVATLDGNLRTVAQADDDDAPSTVTPESIWFTTWDGREIPGYFFKPEGEGPFPALVEIHGGPESQRRLDYDTNGPALQYLTSLGIAVLALNVRGSKGYGKAYCHLDDKGKRLDALRDVAEAAAWLQSKDDIVGSKIAVYGISYGGFMTLSSLVRYPEIWAAGVEMVGMASLVTFLERTGPWRRKHREGEYGELATEREMLESVSPLPLVDNISAPLMVFHGRQDARVPLYESEQIVEAVKKRGLDVVLRVYEDEGHVFSKRRNIVDAFGLIGEFLTRHLDPPTRGAHQTD